MIAVVGLAVIAFLAVVVGGLFFLGGKREKPLQTHAHSAEEKEELTAGYAVDTGSSSPTPKRAVGSGDD